MLNARCLSFSHDQSRRSPRFASSSPGSRLSGLACRFKKLIAGSSVFCGSFGRSPNRSRADAPVLAVLLPEGSLPFRDSARSGSSGLPDGDLGAGEAELVRLARVLPTVSRICHFCDSSTRRCPRRNAAGAGQGHPYVIGGRPLPEPPYPACRWITGAGGVFVKTRVPLPPQSRHTWSPASPQWGLN